MTTLEDRPNTALLVIDVQNGVVGEAHERDTVVASIGTVVEKARAAEVPVVWVQHTSDNLPQGSEQWKIVPELSPDESEPLVQKRYPDSFEETTLESVLDELTVGRLVVVGAQTDECVRSTLHGDVGHMRWVKAAVGKQVKLIPVSEVVYFQSDTKYTRVVLAQGEALIRTPLKELLADLDPRQFWQVHRGTIVNLDAVTGVLREDAERQFIILKNRQERLPISRQFTHLFKQM